MLPEKLTLKSGATLELQMAPFAVSMKLVKTLSNELKLVNLQLEGLSLEKIKGSGIEGIKNAVLQILGSDAVELSLRPCLERCLYNGTKITPDVFESPQAREDYLPVAWEVIKFNAGPFFRNLGLPFSKSVSPTGDDPK